MTLKPCPFCGLQPKTWIDKHYQDRFVIECEDCQIQKRDEYSFEEAAEYWNRRVGETKAKMSNEQYLLTKLSEECNEVGQMASKCQQFGLDEVYDGDGNTLTNRQRLHAEVNDLLGVIDMLNAEEDFDFVPDPIAHLHKRAKISKYRQYSINLGFVEEIKDATNK